MTRITTEVEVLEPQFQERVETLAELISSTNLAENLSTSASESISRVEWVTRSDPAFETGYSLVVSKRDMEASGITGTKPERYAKYMLR